MSNALYDKGREHFAKGDIKWDTAGNGGDTFRAVLLDMAEYPLFDIQTDEYLTDIPADARAATVTLTVLEPVGGILDASNCVFTAVPAGPVCEAIAIYQWTGSDATSLLVVYIDTGSAGMPVTPTGVDVAINWSDLGNKVAKL